MFSRLFTLSCCVLLFGSLSSAQDAAPVDDWKSAITNQEGKVYPQVNSEGRVKFRIVARSTCLGLARYPTRSRIWCEVYS